MSFEPSKDERELDVAVAEEVTDDLQSEPVDPYAAFANPEVRTTENAQGNKQKNKRILLVSLCCAFVLLVAATVFSIVWLPGLLKEDETDTPVVNDSIVLFDKSSSNNDSAITSAVMVSSQYGTTEMVNKDGVLYAKGYEAFTPHAINTGDLETFLTAPTMMQDIGEVENIADFGFDSPVLTATVTYRDGSTYAFEIGDMSPDQSGCYFREKDTKQVYIVDVDSVSILYMQPLDYISTTVFNEPTYIKPSQGETDVVVMRMTLGGTLRKDSKFSFRRVTSEDNDSFLYNTFVITEPFTKGSNATYDTALESFTSLGADRVLCVNPTAAQIKEYGLDNPLSVLTFTLASRTTVTQQSGSDGSVSVTSYNDLETYTLKLSAASSSSYYVMLEGKPIVYLVPASNLTFAEMQYDDFADTLLFLENIDEMGSFIVNLPDEKTTFALSHIDEEEDSAKNLIVKVGDKTYPTMDFRYLVTNFMDIKRYGASTTDTKGLPLKLELAITKRDSSKPYLTIKFYEAGTNLYAVELSHGERYMVKASEVNNAIEQYRNYLNGKTVLR